MKKKLEDIKADNSVPKEKIKEKSISNTINIDFSLFYFPSIKLKDFTNYFKDEISYYKFILNFYHKTLSTLKNSTYTQLESSNHTHYIKDEKKVRLINNILDDYTKKFSFLPLINIEMRQEFYQIDNLSGGRIIGTRYENIFFVLFFDPYHLIYEDSKFNIDRRAYMEESTFYIKESLTVFNSEHLLKYDKCLSCEVMEEICK